MNAQSAIRPTPLADSKGSRIVSVGVLVLLLLIPTVTAAVLLAALAMNAPEAPLIAHSTIGQAVQWHAEQTGALATLPKAFVRLRAGWAAWNVALLVACALSGVGLWRRAAWGTGSAAVALLGFHGLLFNIPALEQARLLDYVLIGMVALSLAVLSGNRSRSRLAIFLAVLSLVFGAWEGFKALARSLDYRVGVPLTAWSYTPYPDLPTALTALQQGEVDALIVQRKSVRDLMPAYAVRKAAPAQAAPSAPYADLCYLDGLPTAERHWGFGVEPELLGRFAVVVRAESASRWRSVGDLQGHKLGALSGGKAVAKFLELPRVAVLLNLHIANNVNLPPLQSIAAAMFQPARRNGDQLLAEILLRAAFHTGQEAAVGFGIGSVLGFVLGALLAHSTRLRRGILPYLVASQAVPILALAPMVVIWLGPSLFAVASIAAYLTFFPVAVNTLRGMLSPDPMSLELVRTYAASPRAVMWKVRVPASVPYLFTALKVAATGSVVGAIIGELPSSISGGLGRVILDLSSNYNAVTTPKLWAAILTAAGVGLVFFTTVSAAESAVTRWKHRTRRPRRLEGE